MNAVTARPGRDAPSARATSGPGRTAIFRTTRKRWPGSGTTRDCSPELEAAIRAGELIDEEKFGLLRHTEPRPAAGPLHLRPDMRVT